MICFLFNLILCNAVIIRNDRLCGFFHEVNLNATFFFYPKEFILMGRGTTPLSIFQWYIIVLFWHWIWVFPLPWDRSRFAYINWHVNVNQWNLGCSYFGRHLPSSFLVDIFLSLVVTSFVSCIWVYLDLSPTLSCSMLL